MEVSLPNGDIVTLRDPETIKERHRRTIESAYLSMSDDAYEAFVKSAETGEPVERRRISAEDLAFFNRVNDVSIVALIATWQHDGGSVEPTVEALQDMDAPSYASLSAAAAPIIANIRIDFSPTPAGEETPTEPASA